MPLRSSGSLYGSKLSAFFVLRRCMISILFRHYILQGNNILSMQNLNPCALEKKYEKTKITEHVLGEKANIAVICKIAKQIFFT